MLRDTLKDFVILPHRDKYGRRIVVFKVLSFLKRSGFLAEYEWSSIFCELTFVKVFRLVTQLLHIKEIHARKWMNRDLPFGALF